MSHFWRFAAILFLISQVWSSIACGGRSEANTGAPTAANVLSENADNVKTNVEELSLLINIPYEAEDISWKEDKSQRKLYAVLRFDKVDTDKLMQDLAKSGAAVDANIEAEEWFHPELRSQSEMKGDTTLKGKSYPASVFYSQPYDEGTITRIEGTDFFVLELSAK